MRRLVNKFSRENILLLKIASFISSMFPLSLFLLLKYVKNNKKIFMDIEAKHIVVFIFIIELISILYIVYFYKWKTQKGYFNVEDYHLKEIRLEKTNTSNYLLANVLPIITLEMEKSYSLIFYICLIILLGFMYVKNNLYYVNPLYDILNIKVFSASVYYKDKLNSEITFIISMVSLYEFDNNIYRGIRFRDILIITEEVN